MASSSNSAGVQNHELSHSKLPQENRDIAQLMEKEALPDKSDDDGDSSAVHVVARKPTASSDVVETTPKKKSKALGKKRGPYKKKRKLDADGNDIPKPKRKRRGPYKKKGKKGDNGIEDDNEDGDGLISKEDGLMFPLALYADYIKQSEKIALLKQTVAQLTATTQYWKAKASNLTATDDAQVPLPPKPPAVIDLYTPATASLIDKETACLLASASTNPPVKSRKKLHSELEQSYNEAEAKEHVKRGDFFYFAKQPDALYGRYGEKFKEGYRDLIQYKGEHGNCNVPKSFENKKLANFVVRMRREHHNYAKIQEEAEANGGPAYTAGGAKIVSSHNQPRMDALNCIRFQWKMLSADVLEENWEANRQKLLEHFKIHKTFRIDKRLNKSLYKWTDNQRRFKNLLEKMGKSEAMGFTWERKAKLDEIGFAWTSAEDPMPEEAFRKLLSGKPFYYK